MISFLLIGALVGIVMGLTGAGGALISIPLFISLTGSSIKEATALSLIVVFIGALLNLISSKDRPDIKTSLALLAASSIGSYLSLPLKKSLPDSGIALILILIATYSVWGVWSKKKLANQGPSGAFLWKRSLAAGIILGALTTLTGLGGGVLLVPIFIKFFSKDYSEALSTSLLSIALVSSLSLYFQRDVVMNALSLAQAGGLFLGALGGALLLKFGSKKVSPSNLDKIRKTSFTIVAAYSIGSFALNVIY